ncbi:MAG TPA: hypothetical protein PLN86_16000, partial [Candidatus Hydrogenedentes bacterium]|nr:hypothetical protein [Candidatus Hydrogenedentota bacterium]
KGNEMKFDQKIFDKVLVDCAENKGSEFGKEVVKAMCNNAGVIDFLSLFAKMCIEAPIATFPELLIAAFTIMFEAGAAYAQEIQKEVIQ